MRPLILMVLALSVTTSVAAVELPLRLGTNIWPGYEPLYLAADRHDWSQRINVRLVEYPSATGVLRAFRNRALEAAALTLDEALMLREAELPVQVVAVLDISHGGDVILAQPEFSSFGDLAGRRIGVESGALGAYVLSRALMIHGLELADVNIVHIEVSEHESAFLEQSIDAVVTFDPVRTRLLSAGATAVFDSTEIPGEIVDVLVVHQEVVDHRPDQLRALIGDWFAALEYRQSSPEASAAFTARRLKISPEEVVASYQGLKLPNAQENKQLLTQGLRSTVTELHKLMLDEQLLLRAVAVDDLFSDEFLPDQ